MDPHEYEERVRRMARSLWRDFSIGRDVLPPLREGGGPTELDVRIETRTEVIFVDATMAKSADVVRQKIATLKKHFLSMRGRFGKPMRGYIVTAHEPTQHQIEAIKAAKTANIQLLSYNQLQQLVVDAAGYLARRSAFRFGSVRGFGGRAPPREVPLSEFVTPHYAVYGGQSKVSFEDIVRTVCSDHSNARYLVAGYFGMGKSMTLRAVFDQCRRDYEADRIARFPVHINLVDHQAQQDPDEALRRHAKKIGFEQGADGLVAAWRSGLIILLLDGFDELIGTSWSGELAKRRAYRRQAMALVKGFVDESPSRTPIVISGRWTYFDQTSEMYDALGVAIAAKNGAFIHVDIEDFSTDQLGPVVS